jgi:serine/threonine protein kinase
MLAAHDSEFARVGVAGHYRVMSVLGRGGMGEVYLAEDPRLGRKVALKILPPQFTTNPDSLRRFEQEARAASSLNHPNIITIYDIGQFADVRFLVMELVEGETLRQMLGRSVPLERIARLGVQIAQALKVAHAAAIVHRDNKPENIMVRTDGYVKVLDFGLARLVPAEVHPQSDETVLRTRAGTIVGTPRYMSPEQARGQSGSAASDIFSLGTVLYELAAGRPPFGGETAATILNSILTDEPSPPSRINPAVTAAMKTVSC